MKSHKAVFVNPSRITMGTAFVLPAAQTTLAGAVPQGLDIELRVVDEAVERFDPETVGSGDIVCVSVLTNTVHAAYRVVQLAKERGATVVVGGPHVSLLPREALSYGADAVVRGDGDTVIGKVFEDCLMKRIISTKIYQDPKGNPFMVPGEDMAYPRLDLVDANRYVAASLRSSQGCPEHCTFCTVPAISGHDPRERPVEMVAREARELHRLGIRFVVWGADNLVPYPLSLVREAPVKKRKAREYARERSLQFFRKFGALTENERVWGFAQLTLRLHDDPEMLHALTHDANICAALFGIESVDPVALKQMAKHWNGSKDQIIERVQCIQRAGIHPLGSMIVGLPNDTPETIEAMRSFAVESGMSVAQFPIYEILPGSTDHKIAARDLFQRNTSQATFPIFSPKNRKPKVELLRDAYWLELDDIPHLKHPYFSMEELKEEGRKSWRYFYRLRFLVRNGIRFGWPRRRILVYALVCKTFATFYGGEVGLSADNVRTGKASLFMRKLMAAAAWGMRKIPPPPPPSSVPVSNSPSAS